MCTNYKSAASMLKVRNEDKRCEVYNRIYRGQENKAELLVNLSKSKIN